MGSRGRKSAAELATVTCMTRKAPAPVPGLTDDQAAIWKRLAAAKPAEHFTPDDLPLLAELCRAYDGADKLALRINRAIEKEFSSETLQALMGIRDKETRRAMALATKLRLTAQSRYDKQVAATLSRQAGKGPRPWETNPFDSIDEDPGERFFSGAEE